MFHVAVRYDHRHRGGGELGLRPDPLPNSADDGGESSLASFVPGQVVPVVLIALFDEVYDLFAQVAALDF